jgi:small ligand-binding sensory domain FIST
VCSGLRGALDGPPDLLICFASPLLAPDLGELPERLLAAFPGAALVGCTAAGVIGDGREVEGAAALAVTAARLPGATVAPLHFGSDPERWAAAAPVDPDAQPAFLLLPEPFRCDVQALVTWLDAAFPDSPKLGGIASGGDRPGSSRLFLGERVYERGAVGVAIHGDVSVTTVVAQGCRPIGTPMFVTAARGNALFELDGRSALSVLQQVYDGLPARDQELFRRSLFLGLVMRSDQQQYGPGDFLIRNLAGIDPSRGALVVGARLQENAVVQFHVRDAETSAADLAALLRRNADARPEGALMFSCLGRGLHLYGRADHDTDMFRERFGPVPLGGFFCNGELGQVRGQTFLHGYTSSFGLFRARGH